MNENQIRDARLLMTSAPALIPLIQSLHDLSYDKLLTGFRSGEKDNLALVAECNAYKTIIEEINYKINNLEAHFKKEQN